MYGDVFGNRVADGVGVQALETLNEPMTETPTCRWQPVLEAQSIAYQAPKYGTSLNFEA
jgi:hypothetical protein